MLCCDMGIVSKHGVVCYAYKVLYLDIMCERPL